MRRKKLNGALDLTAAPILILPKYSTEIQLRFIMVLVQCAAQNINFKLASPQPAINEVYSGSILSGDIDNDGDIDLFQSGVALNLMGTTAKATVFLNDGKGNFTIKEQNFNNFFNTEQIWMGDLDNDKQHACALEFISLFMDKLKKRSQENHFENLHPFDIKGLFMASAHLRNPLGSSVPFIKAFFTKGEVIS